MTPLKPNNRQAPMKNRLNENGLSRELGWFSAATVVVANMVGTGIFTTSGLIMKQLGDPVLLLWCWAAGGVFALCGALCYGELGARFPNAGGEYVYLREAFGTWAGFLSGWISLIVGFSAPIAASAMAFSTYLFTMMGIDGGSGAVWTISSIRVFVLGWHSMVAIAVILVFTFIHYHSLRYGARVQNALTTFKVAIILAFIVLAAGTGDGAQAASTAPTVWGNLFGGPFAVSLIFVTFAYSGWNAASYLGGEILHPRRNLPLSLIAGTLVVTALYMGLNAVFLRALTPEQMAGVVDVSAKAASALWGPATGRWVAGAIALGLLSVLSAMIMTGPRVYFAMARDGVFFQVFGRLSRVHRTPAWSIFLQAGIGVLMVVTASFETLLIYIGFTLSLSAAATVAGLVWLRRRSSLTTTGYRTWGYPVTPLLFIAGNLWIVVFTLRSRMLPGVFGAATIGLGALLYRFFRQRSRD
jgi:APA family basic amino acid/polyamine antiporter